MNIMVTDVLTLPAHARRSAALTITDFQPGRSSCADLAHGPVHATFQSGANAQPAAYHCKQLNSKSRQSQVRPWCADVQTVEVVLFQSLLVNFSSIC